MNYYEILGVTPNATLKEVKSAYKKMAKIHHPDKNNGDKNSEEIFKKITHAYQELLKGNTSPPQQSTNTNPNYKYYQYGSTNRQEPPRYNYSGYRNKDIHVDTPMTLEEIYKGTTRNILYPVENHRTAKLTVSIPASVDDGASFVFKQKGEFINFNQPAGNLIVRISEQPHPTLKRISKYDLEMSVKLNYLDILIGSTSKLKCIDGGEITVNIPTNATTGNRLRVAGKGMMKQDGTRGDMFVEIDIDKLELTEQQKEALRYVRDNIKE